MDEISGPVIREFRDDDAGYLAWLAAHPDGHVTNILHGYSPSTARMHQAGCRTISGKNPHGGKWTWPYVKICADDLREVEQWAIYQVGKQSPECKICRPARNTASPPSIVPLTQTPMPLASDARYEIRRPAGNSPVVEAWADDYIRFERLPTWQKALRSEIRRLCGQLEPSAEQVLHASYFGSKHPNADVENVLLYYIDSFKVAGRNGIRFEYGSAVPPARKGVEYPFCYRYALAPRSHTFTDWQQGRTLATFGWTDLGAFAGEKKCAQLWLALARSRADVTVQEPLAAESPFALGVQLRPPLGRQPVWGAMVKGVFDGVISAFQAHIDPTVLPIVSARLASYLPADPDEITEHMLDQRHAVLGAVHRLISPYQAGVQWNPADHLCVAGELLAAEPVDRRWAIRGDLVEIARRGGAS